MNLFCNRCGCNHAYTPSSVERIVYTLSAMEADARRNGPTRIPDDCEPDCLEGILGASCEGEDYMEWTDGEIEKRKNMSKREAVNA